MRPILESTFFFEKIVQHLKRIDLTFSRNTVQQFLKKILRFNIFYKLSQHLDITFNMYQNLIQHFLKNEGNLFADRGGGGCVPRHQQPVATRAEVPGSGGGGDSPSSSKVVRRMHESRILKDG